MLLFWTIIFDNLWKSIKNKYKTTQNIFYAIQAHTSMFFGKVLKPRTKDKLVKTNSM